MRGPVGGNSIQFEPPLPLYLSLCLQSLLAKPRRKKEEDEAWREKENKAGRSIVYGASRLERGD